MSYGVVIGYCRGDDFFNVVYGYSMLFVIGGLYGCMGGGFVGLSLEATKEKEPEWAGMITEMVAGAFICWGFIIYQLEWFMTPPRSELWAACLGASIAMLWHLYRKGFRRAFRVAWITTAGAGFGFAFGNFIQGLGIASGIGYNWWNVMEFTLGLCGGVAMTYAVATTHWPGSRPASKPVNLFALVSVFLLIPLINFSNAFTVEKLQRLAERLNRNPDNLVPTAMTLGMVLIVFFAISAIYFWNKKSGREWNRSNSLVLPALLIMSYVSLSFICKGFVFERISIANSVTLYLPILTLGLLAGYRADFPVIFDADSKTPAMSRVFICILAVIIVVALLSLTFNDPGPNVPVRF